ncbi:MAG: dockerin type I domain-containing protein [Planctomycetota bacterium]
MRQRPTRSPSKPVRKLSFESLEARRVMTSLPFGASTNDLGEFMLGRIAVTPVLLESNGAIDVSTEDWTSSHVQTVMNNITQGLNWWNRLLAKESSVHTLEWVIDRTYVDNRLPTPYEPINRISNVYELWVGKFLSDIGFSNSSDLEQNVRSFNQSQRVKLQTDWSFTIFVVNSDRDPDDSFAFGGSFSRAFAFAGGLFMVVPSGRPDSTFAHEAGHIFWARDEYANSGSYFDRRGYYNVQNTNAMDNNPNPTFQQPPSIMSSARSLELAYEQVVSPDATLAMIGWRDTDGDGIFDVLDVPLQLQGTGRYQPTASSYRFSGRASVQTLPNQNSSGLQNDITLNRVGRIEYRIGTGAWTTLSSPNTYVAELDLSIPIDATDLGKTIEIRAIDPRIGLTSTGFSGRIGNVPDTTTRHGIQGFVWNDADQSRAWDASESGLVGATVRLVDSQNQPVSLQRIIEPDNYPTGPLSGNLGGVRLDAVGTDANGMIAVANDPNAATGARIIRPYSFLLSQYVEAFSDQALQLRARFDNPTSFVSLDAIAARDNANVRLDAYAADGTLIKRFERRGMLRNERVTMEVATGSEQIAYVIARGFQNTSVKFDQLRFGPRSEARTASDGSYFLENLPPGDYRVQVVGPVDGSIPTNATGGIFDVGYGNQQSVTHVDFGIFTPPSPWRNPILPEDVNGVDGVNPLDVLILINEINQNGARPLSGSSIVAPPYLDVDGDRAIGPLDVLMVINYINSSGVNRGGLGEGELSAPPIVIETNHGTDQPRMPSFALDRAENAPTTWIVYRSGSNAVRREGPDRCGCPSCTGWDQVNSDIDPMDRESSPESLAMGPHRELDAAFAVWD